MTRYEDAELGRRYLEFIASHEPRSLEIGPGVALEYLDAGTGDPLLLLPGGTGDALGAFVLVEGLESSARVLVPSYPPAENLDGVLDAVAAMLAAEGVERTRVWGHGFGGIVAQTVMRTRPDVVSDVILSEATVPTGERTRRAEKQLRTFSKMTGFMARRMVPLAFRRTLGGNDRDEQRFWEAFLSERFAARSKDVVTNLARLAVEFYRNGLELPPSRWIGRMLVLESDADESYEAMREPLRAMYPDAIFETFTGAAEDAPSALWERYVAAVRAFLISSS